jgi:hypothetical protein
MAAAPDRRMPTVIEKRELLYGRGAPPAELDALGAVYLAAGQPDEALHFFHKAGNRARMGACAAEALAEGDFFTFRLARTLLESSPTPEEWRALAGEARGRGKESFALLAEKAAGGPAEGDGKQSP